MTNTSTTGNAALIQVAKVLSNEMRLRILDYLNQNKCAQVSSFTRMLNIPASDASKSLRLLRRCGLVQREKVGNIMIHSLNEELWIAVQILWKTAQKS